MLLQLRRLLKPTGLWEIFRARIYGKAWAAVFLNFSGQNIVHLLNGEAVNSWKGVDAVVPSPAPYM